jgi:glycosyltransferase involved in cell wall biosynthesis
MRPATVSVLIPCYNAEAYLDETLRSALAQTLLPAEILVVDDASTDRSREIAARFAPQVTLLDNVGRGASAARNRASQQAQGEFFQYLDADDLLEPHALASRVEALDRERADVAISDWTRLVRSSHEWVQSAMQSGKPPEDPGPLDLKVLRGFWAPPAAILYRRSVWERVGDWRETLPVIQDARFLLDAARLHSRFCHVPGSGAKYRQHLGGSLSTGGDVRFWRDVLTNAREVEVLWERAQLTDAQHRETLSSVYAHCARVGFGRDSQLFADSSRQLNRFADCKRPRFVRISLMLSKLLGYSAATAMLAPFRWRTR